MSPVTLHGFNEPHQSAHEFHSIDFIIVSATRSTPTPRWLATTRPSLAISTSLVAVVRARSSKVLFMDPPESVGWLAIGASKPLRHVALVKKSIKT